MFFNSVLLFCVLSFHSGHSSRCFECNGVSSPDLCTTVTTCKSSETCYIEQIVTDLGEILYNTGCIDHLQCHNRKRAVGSPATGIITCGHCCRTDFCNRYGCGKSEPPRDQRGPHCFSCDGHTSADSCTNVTTCDTDKSCLIHVPYEFAHLSLPVYRSQCETKKVCAALAIAEHEGPCPANCCDGDYCNDHCLYSGIQTTTLPVVTNTDVSTDYVTTGVAIITNSTAGTSNACDTSDGYVAVSYDLQHQMCIKVHYDNQEWLQAELSCKMEGASLIVTQTNAKISALKYFLTSQNIDRRDYWIGLYDKNGNDAFYWMTGELLTDSDWGSHPQQPTLVYQQKDEDCVEMYHGEPLLWHDTWCSHTLSYICERR